MAKHPETRIVVSVKKSDYGSDLHLFDALFVFVDPKDGVIKNPSGFYVHTEPWETSMADLHVRAQADPTGAFYGYKPSYDQIYSLELDRAEICVKTLRRVERHLQKRQQQFGYPQDLWSYLGRFAEAFDVDTYGFATSPRPLNYSTEYFRWGDIDFARYRVEEQRKQWTEGAHA